MSKLIASAGPFAGVRKVSNAPYIDSRQFLLDAQQCYLRDPANNSSVLQRPPITITGTVTAGHPMQGAHVHVDPATGTVYRFFVANGKLWIGDAALGTFTDVTPVATAIDASAGRVSFASVGSVIVVSDGVHRPWIGTNLGGTPITGTYISIDGTASTWTAWGVPTVYQDSVFFITATVPGGSAVTPRVGLVWSEPNQPSVGYTQTNYADFWNIIENGTDPLYAILGTNNGLFYWRAESIGLAAGTPSINFSTTATRDARSVNVGSVSPWAVAQFGSNIFFVDIRGRPWMMPMDGEPQPIWEQFYSETLVGSTGLTTAIISQFATGAIAPEINQYVVAPWSATNSPSNPPRRAYIFDAETGAYGGLWTNQGNPGEVINIITVQRDSDGVQALCLCGGGATVGDSFVYLLNPVSSNFTTADVRPVVVTGLMSYSADTDLYPDHATIIASSGGAMDVTVATAYNSASFNAAVTPGASLLGNEYRATLGLDGVATRFLQFTITGPQFNTTQWGVQRIEVFGSASPTGPEDR